jgi:hypothetical protein
MPNTTDFDFNLYKTECLNWVEKFNLKNWDIFFNHQKIESDTLACVIFDVREKSAIFKLNTKWPAKQEYNSEEIRRCAYHEVMELLLGKLNLLCVGMRGTQEDVNEEIHNIIYTIEKLFFGNRQ